MRTRTTIELTSTACRLVEVEMLPGQARPVTLGDIRVRSFIPTLSLDAADPAQLLQGLRAERKLARGAVVILWGLRTTQQFLRLPPARPADLELIAARESRKDLASFDADGGATISVSVGDEVQVGAARRREVALVAAAAGEVQRRIEPITAAGFVVDRVVTPALALADLARTNRETTPTTVAVYVAVDRDATCIAITRGSLLLFAREMPWGHGTDDMPGQESVAARLTSELRRSVLYFKQTFRAAVETVVLCGDHPKLRALTAPLAEALRVPVQTLDSLVGVDAVRLPEPADRFRASVAALRPAIAAGAVPSSTSLLPASVLRNRATRVQSRRMAAAIAAAVVLTVSWYAIASRTASAQHRELLALQQQLSMLQPRATESETLRHAHAVSVAQRATLTAYDSQGPRMARVLEALAHGTPPDVVLTGIELHPQGVTWRLSVSGTALTEDPASGQAALNSMLNSLAQSPYIGAPIEPPAVRVLTGTTTTDSATARTDIPAGMSGVEFTLQFDVAR